MSAPYLGDFPADQAVYFMWSTNDADGASVTRTVDGTISVYKDNSDGSSYDQTQVTTGVTNDEDVDALTGVHSCCITTTDAWYETGHDYTVVLSGSTIDAQTVNAVLAHFSIENRSPLRPTTSGRTLDVTATGAAGIDWGNVENKATANDLSATDIQLCDTTTTNSDMLTAAAVVNGIGGRTVDVLDYDDTLKRILAAVSGNYTIANSNTVTFLEQDGVTTEFTATVDGNSRTIT